MSQSGLGRFKRDFSDAETSGASCPSKLINQDPPRQKRRQELAEEEKKEIANKRLSVIKQALASMNEHPSQHQQQRPPPAPLEQSIAVNQKAGKRPSLESTEAGFRKKQRQLPPSWKNDSLSNPSLSSTTKSTNENRSRYSGNGNGNGNGTGQESKHASTTVSNATSTAVTKNKDKIPTVFLSQEQTHILKLVKEGNSVFYTGSAGTGKSVLLREIIREMKKLHSKNPEAVAVTASTGIAACNIGGVTIHSFAGIGLGIETAEDLATKVKKNRKALMRWIRAKVLIIDEVSMVDGDLFDKLARVGRILRKGSKGAKGSDEPFGGIQLVVTGDFFQLPPVNKLGAQVKFAFEADEWHSTIKKTFNLTKVFRQKDQKFVSMLNEMRFGRLSRESINTFTSLSRKIVYEDGLGPTELFPRREDVERSNGQRMQKLSTEEAKYQATDGGTLVNTEQGSKMLSHFMAPSLLHLCVDAQVMLIKNVDEQLVNGTMGRVTRFVDPATFASETGNDIANGAGVTSAIPKKSAYSTRHPEVEFSFPNGSKRTMLVMQETWKVELPNGEVQVSRTQLPLILAWAMSIHKSQGQTLDRVKVDLNRVFEKGQAYVALSRATSLEGLQVLNFDPNKVNAHNKVAEWTQTLETISDDS